MSNVDILNIDIQIKNHLQNEFKKLNKYKTQLEILEKKSLIKSDYKTKDEILSEIKKLKEKIESLDNNLLYHTYVLRTSKILEEYKNIINTTLKISFNKTNEDTSQKKKLINEYLLISSEYVTLNKKKYSKSPEYCKCGSKETINNICAVCGIEFTQYFQHTYDNKDRINNSKKYKYNRNVHFIEVLNQIQGNKIKTIPQEVFTDLEYEFKINNLETKSSITYEKYANITKDDIKKFLKLHNHSKQYININYLYTYYTGKSSLNISNLTKTLLSEFEELLKAFDKLVSEGEITGRTSFINAHYVAYQLLCKHGLKPDISDFNISKDKLEEYNDLYSKLCRITNFNMVHI